MLAYLLAIAGQTAGPNWLTCFREPQAELRVRSLSQRTVTFDHKLVYLT